MPTGAHAHVDAMYRAHAPHVLRRARQILGDAAEAEEALHEIFEGLVKRPDQLEGHTSPTAWFYMATTHLCLNRMRNRKNRERILAARAVEDSPPSSGASPEVASIARDILSRLPDDEATCAVAYYVDGMTHAEIAQILGCSRRHVGDLLVRIEAYARRGEES